MSDRRSEELQDLIADYLDRLNSGDSLDYFTILSEHPEMGPDIIEQLETFIGLDSSPYHSPACGTLGDYTLRRQIGRGGMGTVYDAWQNSMDRRVALKVLPRALAADTKAVTRFIREAQIAGKLDHPNVVHVHGTGVEDQVPYYAMEYVEGKTLTQVLARIQEAKPEADTPFGTKDEVAYFHNIAKVFADVADGLQHAHSRGVTHRDIKPSNLILDGDGRLRILDFGLARLEGHESLTASGDCMGTPLYMSPEQARRKSVPVDHRTDVYSLGATLYEVLTGHPPFRGKDHHDTLSQIIDRNPVAPRKSNPRVPMDLETVVLKCLRKDADDRYGTAEALAQDLRRFVRGDSIEARPQSRWELLSRRLRAYRGRITVAAIITIAVAAVGVYLTAERRGRIERTTLAVHSAMAEARTVVGEAERRGEIDLVKWEAAIGAATRARELARAGEAGEELEAEATRLLHEVGDAARDATMVRRLEQIPERRVERGVTVFGGREQDQYLAAFRDYGIDIDALEMGEAVRRITASRISDVLCLALGDWAWLRRGLKREEGARRLLEIAYAAESDPWRKMVREAVLVGDVEKVEELSREIEPADLDLMAVPLIVQSLEHVDRGRESVVELLRKAQIRYPGNFWITYRLAEALEPLGHEDAVGYYRAALSLRPSSVEVRDYLGVVLERRGDLDGALENWREVVRIRPDFFHVYEHLIPALEKKGVEVTTLDTLRETLGFDRENAGVYVALALAFQRRSKHHEAIEAFRRATQLQESGEAYRYLGRALLRKALCESCLGNENKESVLRDSIDACEKALRAYEEEPASDWYRSRVWASMGRARNALRDTQGAIEAYRKAVDLSPDDERAYDGLGVLLEAGRLSEAVSWYRQGVRRGLVLFRFPIEYAGALLKLHKHDEAIAFCRAELPRLRAAAESDPDNIKARVWLAGVLITPLEEFDEAAEELRTAIELAPRDTTARRFLGIALHNKGDLAGALEAWKVYVELKEEQWAWGIRGLLGQVLRMTGDVDGAALQYREALRFGNSAWIHLGLGFALLGRGEADQGLDQLLRYHELAGWSDTPFYPPDRWPDDCRAISRLSTQWNTLASDETPLSDPQEQLRFAWLCSEVGLYARAASLYARAFAVDDGLGDAPKPDAGTLTHRANAACAALRVGVGQGRDTAALDESQRAKWRSQALAWFREELVHWDKELEGASDQQRRRVRRALRHLRFDNSACTLTRYEGNLAKLPKDEQEAFRALWKDVERVLARAKEDTGDAGLRDEKKAEIRIEVGP